ncbi:MAG: hypothetical protein LC130_33400 [Bryobacterales bacterium]|nr:hypothetical protein [Bryobacterales bacterium]
MNDNVATSLQWSAKAFVDLVWPCIAPWMRGGELIPVESAATKEFANSLDVYAGIDAWHLCHKSQAMRGIASRVQKIAGGKAPYNTFTIRYQLEGGTKTEYAKRITAIRDRTGGWLYPYLTVQAYVDQDKKRLLSCAAVRTEDLYTYVEARLGRDGESVPIKSNEDDGNKFIVVEWSLLKRAGVQIRTYAAPSVNHPTGTDTQPPLLLPARAPSSLPEVPPEPAVPWTPKTITAFCREIKASDQDVQAVIKTLYSGNLRSVSPQEARAKWEAYRKDRSA